MGAKRNNFKVQIQISTSWSLQHLFTSILEYSRHFLTNIQTPPLFIACLQYAVQGSKPSIFICSSSVCLRWCSEKHKMWGRFGDTELISSSVLPSKPQIFWTYISDECLSVCWHWTGCHWGVPGIPWGLSVPMIPNLLHLVVHCKSSPKLRT